MFYRAIGSEGVFVVSRINFRTKCVLNNETPLWSLSLSLGLPTPCTGDPLLLNETIHDNHREDDEC